MTSGKNYGFDSLALPGKAQSLAGFRRWLKNAESASTLSLKDAKAMWGGKRELLQKEIPIKN